MAAKLGSIFLAVAPVGVSRRGVEFFLGHIAQEFIGLCIDFMLRK